MGKILKKKGFQTKEASTGKEAIEIIKNDKDIVMVLLDIMLPDMDGYEVLSKILPYKNERGFKVLFVSGKKDKDGVLRAIQSGGDDYLVKPVFPDALFAKISLLLGTDSIEQSYNEVKCAFSATLLASKIVPDLHVTELTELTILLRSTAAIKEDTQIEIGSKKLSYYLKHDGSYTLKVTKCTREAMGKYFIRCRFVGITEAITKEIRSLAIKGKLLS